MNLSRPEIYQLEIQDHEIGLRRERKTEMADRIRGKKGDGIRKTRQKRRQ